MPRPRFTKLTEERQRELLEAAATEFAEHGYQGASLNRILSSVGSSKGAFYYYFDDKADLFETVAGFTFDYLMNTEQSYELGQLDLESYWPHLEQWFLEQMRRVHELPWLAGLGKLIYSPGTHGLDELVGRHFQRIQDWLTALLTRGREVGAVRTDVPLDLLQLMLTGAMEASDRWFVEHWDDLEPHQRDELAAITFNVARNIMEPPPGQ